MKCERGSAHHAGAFETCRAALRPAVPDHAAARMAAGAAQDTSPVDGRPVLRGPGHRPDHEELIEGQVPVMPVSAADPKFLLDVERRQHLGALTMLAQPRRIALEQHPRQVHETLRSAHQPPLSA